MRQLLNNMKNFDNWNKIKKEIDFCNKNILPAKRQVWWLSVGLNIGVEEDGKNENFERPVLVIKVFSRDCFLGIPITSSCKENKIYYFPIRYNKNVYYLILSQIRLFSVKRLSRKIFKISSEDFLKIKNEMRKVIGL